MLINQKYHFIKQEAESVYQELQRAQNSLNNTLDADVIDEEMESIRRCNKHLEKLNKQFISIPLKIKK